MKTKVLFIILFLGLLGGLYFLVTRNSAPKITRKFDREMRFSPKTYRPYDIRFFTDQVRKNAKKGYEINTEKPDNYNKKLDGNGKLMFITSPYFLPNDEETWRLLDFANEGNLVFISSINISPVFLDSLLVPEVSSSFYNNYPPIPYDTDSLTIVWNKSKNDSSLVSFTYPGHDFNMYPAAVIEKSDIVEWVAKSTSGEMALGRVSYGKGYIYFLEKPISTTNYFLLHKNNYQYFNRLWEQLEGDSRTIIWDEFYSRHTLQRPNMEFEKPGESYFWQVIGKHPPLQWAIITFLTGIGLYILIHFRRLQQPVRIIPDNKNTSYEFVEALSSLYWKHQDHKLIADKIVVQFHEYLHSQFRIFAKDLNRENAEKIAQKTNGKKEDLLEIISQINIINASSEVSKAELMNFYRDIFKYISHGRRNIQKPD